MNDKSFSHASSPIENHDLYSYANIETWEAVETDQFYGDLDHFDCIESCPGSRSGSQQRCFILVGCFS